MLRIVAVASVVLLAACGAKEETPATDATAMAVDSMGMKIDSMGAKIDSMGVKIDSLAADSTAKKM